MADSDAKKELAKQMLTEGAAMAEADTNKELTKETLAKEASGVGQTKEDLPASAKEGIEERNGINGSGSVTGDEDPIEKVDNTGNIDENPAGDEKAVQDKSIPNAQNENIPHDAAVEPVQDVDENLEAGEAAQGAQGNNRVPDGYVAIGEDSGRKDGIPMVLGPNVSRYPNVIPIAPIPILVHPIFHNCFVSEYGIMTLYLRQNIRVDMTLNTAVRILNFNSNITMAMSGNGQFTGMIHPSGNIYQHGSIIEMTGVTPSGNHNYAKMEPRGISFTSDYTPHIYLLNSGRLYTIDHMDINLDDDFLLNVFVNRNSTFGSTWCEQAFEILNNIIYNSHDNSKDIWELNGTRITQEYDGLVRVQRKRNRYVLRTSPTNGNCCIETPYIYSTASCNEHPHVFARCNLRRVFSCEKYFRVEDGHDSAGFVGTGRRFLNNLYFPV